MKNPKIIPSEPTHPRILSDEGVDEKDQKKDVEAVNKPAPMPKPAKNCRTFSEDDEDDSGRFAMNDAESWAAWDAAHQSSGGSHTSLEQLDKYVGNQSGMGVGFRPGAESNMKLALHIDKTGKITGHQHIPIKATVANKQAVYVPSKADDKAQVRAIRETLGIKEKSRFE